MYPHPEDYPDPNEYLFHIDSDGDGLSDGVELLIGTNPYSRDTDGDGISDYEEHLNHTDPLVPNEEEYWFEPQTVAPGSVQHHLRDRYLGYACDVIGDDIDYGHLYNRFRDDWTARDLDLEVAIAALKSGESGKAAGLLLAQGPFTQRHLYENQADQTELVLYAQNQMLRAGTITSTRQDRQDERNFHQIRDVH